MFAQSFFIPRIHFSITKTQLREFSDSWGKVSRIDFVDFNNGNGAGRRAYVHFSHYLSSCESVNEKENKELFEKNGKIQLQMEENYQSLSFTVLLNNKPIPKTELNMDQIASNTIFIGEELKEQAKRISTLENLVTQMMEQNNALRGELAQRDCYVNWILDTHRQAMIHGNLMMPPPITTITNSNNVESKMESFKKAIPRSSRNLGPTEMLEDMEEGELRNDQMYSHVLQVAPGLSMADL